MNVTIPQINECRPEVLAFARLMEYKLRKHDGDYGKAGWKECRPTYLVSRAHRELEEALEALLPMKYNPAVPEDRLVAACECADVGNFMMMLADVAKALDDLLPAPRPKIICLCGSTRFGEAFRKANFEQTLLGNIVLSIGCDFKSDDDLFGTMTAEDRAQVKADLDELHKRKIDLADEVLILNVGGYIGESTRGEIEYAQKLGKVIRYLEPTTDTAADTGHSAQRVTSAYSLYE